MSTNPNIPLSRYDENKLDNSLIDEPKSRFDTTEHDRAIFDSLISTSDTPSRSYSNRTSHLTSYIGSSLQLNCEAMNQVTSGSPDILYWMKDHRVIRLGLKVHQMTNGTLMVHNMSQSDTGIYECVAKRGRERRTTRTQVSIITLENNNSSTNKEQLPSSVSNTSRYKYDISVDKGRKDYLIAALEDVSEKVDKAVDATVQKVSSSSSSKADAVKALRYPIREKERFV